MFSRFKARWKKVVLSLPLAALPVVLSLAVGKGGISDAEAGSIKGGIPIRCNVNAIAGPGCVGATCPATNYTVGTQVSSACIVAGGACGTCAGTYNTFTQNCIFPF